MLPSAQAASSGPTSARLPPSSADAAMATSIAPKDEPMKVTATSRVSRAGLASAPASVRAAPPAGRQRREVGAVTKASVPPTSRAAQVTRPTAGEVTTASAPTSRSGPTMNVGSTPADSMA